MIILHAPFEIARQMEILSEAQRELGHPSYSFDLTRRGMCTLRFLNLPVLAFADVLDFHYGRSFLLRRDLPILKTMRKKVFFHFHGCDVRYYEAGMDYPLNACHHCYKERSARRKRELVTRLREYADGLIVTTPDLLRFVPDATYVPAAVRIREWQPVSSRAHSLPLHIVHAPSDPFVKGTSYIVDALRPFVSRGDVVLSLVHGLPPEKALEIYRTADVAIDQLLIGWYGVFAQEMMALGKPVICYINRDLRSYQGDLPIIEADPESLPSVVKRLVADEDLRKRKGMEGRRFVERVHDSRVVAKQLIKLYHSS